MCAYFNQKKRIKKILINVRHHGHVHEESVDDLSYRIFDHHHINHIAIDLCTQFHKGYIQIYMLKQKMITVKMLLSF